jgi:hypothetical protein
MTAQKNIIDICNIRSARLSLWDTLFRTVTSILSSFKKFPEFAGIIYRTAAVSKEMYTDILRRLSDAVRRKLQKMENPTVGISFTTMLQHTGPFWSRIS